MDAADCTVIVPTFNRAAFVGETLDSLLAQSWPPGQIVVVDDGSTDGTPAALDPFGDRIEVIRKPNGGKATALNAALPLVRHSAVWIFDDDDIALPDGLERHLKALDRNADAGFTISSMLIGRVSPEGRLETTGRVTPPHFDQDELFVRLMETSFIEGQPAAMIRTACLLKAGPFDERLVRSEDYDMFLRLARRFRAVRLEEPTFIQRRHPGPRGNAALVYDGADRHAQWSHYNRLFLIPLLEELALDEFVPRNRDFDRREALVRRFTISMRHGIMEMAERDLGEILRLGGPDLTVREREILSRALTFFTALRETGVERCRHIASLCPGRLGAQIRWHMARGLAYEALGFSRQFRLSEAAALASRIMVLAGTPGVRRMLAEKLGSA